MRKVNVLITGGAGYLGSTLTEHLLTNGYNVTVLDNLMYDQVTLLHLFKRDGFKFESGDVRDKALLQKLVGEHDVIIPLAAIVGMPACKANPELTVAVNYQQVADVLEVLIPADGASIYVFAGPSPMQAVQRYNLFNGGGYLPPKLGLGFTQRVPTLFSQDDIIKEAKSFETNQFPLDFIGVEPGWHSSSYPCTFEWDPGRFPRPKAFLDTLAGMGLSANLWMNPYVSPKSSLYAGIKKYTGSHLVWNGIIPDFTMAQARKLVKDHFEKNHLDLGVGGYKIDEVDGYDNWIWPDVSTFPSGTSAEQMRQIYGLMVQDMTDSWFKEKNKRTLPINPQTEYSSKFLTRFLFYLLYIPCQNQYKRFP